MSPAHGGGSTAEPMETAAEADFFTHWQWPAKHAKRRESVRSGASATMLFSRLFTFFAGPQKDVATLRFAPILGGSKTDLTYG